MINQYTTHGGGNWTDARVERLKKLWNDKGLSASEVAKMLGGFSHCADGGRSAVIGKVHRLGLPPRATLKRKPMVRRPSRRFSSAIKGNPIFRALAEKHAQAGEPYTELVIPEAERKTIITLERDDCRWPIGDPQAADFHFCGKEKVPGLSYCEFHAFRAYQPPPVRRSTVLVFPTALGTSTNIVPEEVDA